MNVILFFVPATIYFWAFAYFFHNPDFVVDNQALASGPLFAIGIAPLLLFHDSEQGTRLRAMLIWFAGMLAGIGVAALFFRHLLEGWTP